MSVACPEFEIDMAKKQPPLPPPPLPPSPPDRVTLLNLKGDDAERDYLKRLSRKTGVPLSEIARRGIAMWAKKHGHEKAPAEWIENGD